METPKNPLSINYRIREGLSRLAVALRIDDWSRAKAAGINPTQLSILTLLEGRVHGLGVKEIAAHLGVSQPTATDSINALERKQLVMKQAGRVDKRSTSVCLTAEGLAVLGTGNDAENLSEQAVDALDAAEQQEFLLSLVKMIRELQQRNAIPVQRMCVNCRYFSPFVHSDGNRPHHCHFIDAPFGQRDLRIDCREHEEADPALRAATWDVFQTG